MTYYVSQKDKALHDQYIAKLEEKDLTRSKHIMKLIKGYMKRYEDKK